MYMMICKTLAFLKSETIHGNAAENVPPSLSVYFHLSNKFLSIRQLDHQAAQKK